MTAVLYSLALPGLANEQLGCRHDYDILPQGFHHIWIKSNVQVLKLKIQFEAGKKNGHNTQLTR